MWQSEGQNKIFWLVDAPFIGAGTVFDSVQYLSMKVSTFAKKIVPSIKYIVIKGYGGATKILTFPIFKLQSTYEIFLNSSKGGAKQALASVGNFMQFNS